jgi:hypothetical protein
MRFLARTFVLLVIAVPVLVVAAVWLCFVVLAFYANGTGLAAIAPATAQWPTAARRTVTLAGGATTSRSIS